MKSAEYPPRLSQAATAVAKLRKVRWLGTLRRSVDYGQGADAVNRSTRGNGGNPRKDDDSRAIEQERAQNLKLPEATVVFGDPVDVPPIPPEYQPLGPSPRELKGRAILQAAMSVEEQSGEPLPPLYLGSDQ